MRAILLILLFLLTACNAVNTQKPVLPTVPAISTTGRTLTTPEGYVQFDWPGVSIETQFTGTSLGLRMDDSKASFYNVFIDDSPVQIVEVRSDTTLILAAGLKNDLHHLLITKRTEGSQGTATFKGLLIDEDAELTPPEPKGRKIEYIGNSITCGFGTDSDDRFEKFRPETENNYQTYAAMTARAFHADAHYIAHSGQGLVRNYGDSRKVSDYNMPDRYLQVFDMQKEPLWNFSSWIPDIVVINLGTNDFSTEPHPDETIFNRAYLNLIRTIRSHYDSVPVFCLVGPMTDEPCYSYVKKMVEANRTFLNDPNVYFIGIPTYLMIPEEDLGASWHPNASGQRKMANMIIPVIASVMDWEIADR
jgi:lysophospholipase L1-like esterase